jgi:hypothetical protein
MVFLLLPRTILMVVDILGAALVARIVATIEVVAVGICCTELLLHQQQDLA